jgi:hypothetical protein
MLTPPTSQRCIGQLPAHQPAHGTDAVRAELETQGNRVMPGQRVDAHVACKGKRGQQHTDHRELVAAACEHRRLHSERSVLFKGTQSNKPTFLSLYINYCTKNARII